MKKRKFMFFHFLTRSSDEIVHFGGYFISPNLALTKSDFKMTENDFLNRLQTQVATNISHEVMNMWGLTQPSANPRASQNQTTAPVPASNPIPTATFRRSRPYSNRYAQPRRSILFSWKTWWCWVAFKTKPCRFFVKYGNCKRGENCNFIHSNQISKLHYYIFRDEATTQVKSDEFHEFKRRAEASEQQLQELKKQNAELKHMRAQMAQRIATLNGLHPAEITDAEEEQESLPPRPPAGFTSMPYTQIC